LLGISEKRKQQIGAELLMLSSLCAIIPEMMAFLAPLKIQCETHYFYLLLVTLTIGTCMVTNLHLKQETCPDHPYMYRHRKNPPLKSEMHPNFELASGRKIC
jgi:hypothetical protein